MLLKKKILHEGLDHETFLNTLRILLNEKKNNNNYNFITCSKIFCSHLELLFNGTSNLI